MYCVCKVSLCRNEETNQMSEGAKMKQSLLTEAALHFPGEIFSLFTVSKGKSQTNGPQTLHFLSVLSVK